MKNIILYKNGFKECAARRCNAEEVRYCRKKRSGEGAH